MRRFVPHAIAGLLIFAAVASRPMTDSQCRTTIRLLDAENGGDLPGVVRIKAAGDGSLVKPTGLVCRGWGLDSAAPISEWYVANRDATVHLPRTKLVIEALSGIETEKTTVEIDLTDDLQHDIKIPIRRFSNLARENWYSANTHLHLRALSPEQSDQYLKEIPPADRLDLLFISYLERAGDDRDYITNRYAVGRLEQFDSSGVPISNGQEHRHNFGPQGEGYGHVMLLGIRELVQPVSIGYGISKKHPDAPPIRQGIDAAHDQGGTAIWCHNNWGFEDVPNWLTGRLDAQNIFDGGSHGGYAESFYRYLNAGLRVPFSTGTDWFQYDFSRAYVRVTGEVTHSSWLDGLRAGRTFITNGPLIEFNVNGQLAGEVISLAKPDTVAVRATARGRLDFGQFEIVRNGRVIESAPARDNGEFFEATIEMKLDNAEPCWLAARVTASGKSEYGYPLFAHSSPVYVTLGEKAVRIEADVRFLMNELKSARSAIHEQARFDNDAQATQILGMYDEAIAKLETP